MVLIMIGSQDENNTYRVIKNRLQQSWHKIHEKRSSSCLSKKQIISNCHVISFSQNVFLLDPI